MPFGIDDALFGGLLAGGGSALSGAFGGNKNPGPSKTLQLSREGAFNQANNYKDAFYGTNWRKGLGPNEEATAQSIKSGDLTLAKNVTYPGGRGGRGGNAGGSLYGGSTPYGTAPILQQLYGASNAGLREGQQSLNDYNAGSEQAYRLAAQYGTGQNKVIEADAAKALKDANAMTMARAQRSGLGGSSYATDMLGANAAGNLREMMRAKSESADRATGLKLQQRNQANTGRAALQQQVYGRNDQMRMLPIQGQLNTLNSRIVNPVSIEGGSAPEQPQNGMLAQLGNTAGTLGGLFLAKGLYDRPNQTRTPTQQEQDTLFNDYFNF